MANLASQLSPRILLPSDVRITLSLPRTSSIYVGAGDVNSDPCGYTACTSPIVPNSKAFSLQIALPVLYHQEIEEDNETGALLSKALLTAKKGVSDGLS